MRMTRTAGRIKPGTIEEDRSVALSSGFICSSVGDWTAAQQYRTTRVVRFLRSRESPPSAQGPGASSPRASLGARRRSVRLADRDLHERLGLDLDSRVVDIEPAVEQGVQLAEDPVARGEVLDENVAAHGVLARREGPDVEIMHLTDPSDPAHCRGDLGQIHVRGRGLEQDIDRLSDQPPRPRHDEEADGGADEGIGRPPAGGDDYHTCDENTDRAEGR